MCKPLKEEDFEDVYQIKTNHEVILESGSHSEIEKEKKKRRVSEERLNENITFFKKYRDKNMLFEEDHPELYKQFRNHVETNRPDFTVKHNPLNHWLFRYCFER